MASQIAVIFRSVFPFMGPIFAALMAATLINLISESIAGPNRLTFQAAVFSLLTLASSYYLIVSDLSSKVPAIWKMFVELPGDMQFATALLVICVSYFGSFLLTSSPTLSIETSFKNGKKSSANVSPATCDSVVTFDVPATLPEQDKVLFEESFDRFVREIIADLPTVYELNYESVEWVNRMIAYTVAGGKMNRGLALMAVQQEFAKARGYKLTNKERLQSSALGWCIEFLQAFFLVADDVMDDSVTRRGQPCWFRLPEVKLIAINDSFILESCVYKILKRYFGTEPYYAELLDLFIEVTRQTEIGQLLDLTSQPLGGAINLDRFTIERYTSIVKYKTAFYSFYLPVALGMIVSGIKDRKLYDKAREILLIMGEYFQIQDDYLDCYGAPEVIGKIGTDIQDNKCSWLVVQALNRVNSKQRKILQDNYGQHDLKKVSKVKKLYEELGIEEIFRAYEEESYKQIQTLLNEVQNMPRGVFEFLLGKIYKRTK